MEFNASKSLPQALINMPSSEMATTAFDSSWDEGLGHVTATLTEGENATTNEAVVDENAA